MPSLRGQDNKGEAACCHTAACWGVGPGGNPLPLPSLGLSPQSSGDATGHLLTVPPADPPGHQWFGQHLTSPALGLQWETSSSQGAQSTEIAWGLRVHLFLLVLLLLPRTAHLTPSCVVFQLLKGPKPRGHQAQKTCMVTVCSTPFHAGPR